MFIKYYLINVVYIPPGVVFWIIVIDRSPYLQITGDNFFENLKFLKIRTGRTKLSAVKYSCNKISIIQGSGENEEKSMCLCKGIK